MPSRSEKIVMRQLQLILGSRYKLQLIKQNKLMHVCLCVLPGTWLHRNLGEIFQQFKVSDFNNEHLRSTTFQHFHSMKLSFCHQMHLR